MLPITLSICSNYKYETEGGLSFAVPAARIWNNVPLNTGKSDFVLKVLKNSLFKVTQSIPLWVPFRKVATCVVFRETEKRNYYYINRKVMNCRIGKPSTVLAVSLLRRKK